MRHSAKFFILTWCCFVFGSCTLYTEKQSEALSSSAYATKDSIDAARVDLAEKYANELIRLVRPPKKRVEIKSWYSEVPEFKVQASANPRNTKGEAAPLPSLTTSAKQRMVVVPEGYGGEKILVVRSAEYEELVKSKQVAESLQQDLAQLAEVKKSVDEELIQQAVHRDKMVAELNELKSSTIELRLALLKRNIIIVCLLGICGAGVYLRMKGIL